MSLGGTTKKLPDTSRKVKKQGLAVKSDWDDDSDPAYDKLKGQREAKGGKQTKQGGKNHRAATGSDPEEQPAAARYGHMTALAAGATAYELLAEIEDVRKKSSGIQGRQNSLIKRNIIKLRELVHSLVIKAEAAGDPRFLKMRNSELTLQLAEAKAVIECKTAQLKSADKLLKALQPNKGRSTLSKVQASSQATDSLPRPGKANMSSVAESSMETDVLQVYEDHEDHETVWRPPLLGVSAPILTNGKSLMPMDKRCREAELDRQISELMRVRRDISKSNNDDQGLFGRPDSGAGERTGSGKSRPSPRTVKGPRVVSNTQIVPPRREDFPPLPTAFKKLKETESYRQASDKDLVNSPDTWMTAGRKSKVRHQTLVRARVMQRRTQPQDIS